MASSRTRGRPAPQPPCGSAPPLAVSRLAMLGCCTAGRRPRDRESRSTRPVGPVGFGHRSRGVPPPVCPRVTLCSLGHGGPRTAMNGMRPAGLWALASPGSGCHQSPSISTSRTLPTKVCKRLSTSRSTAQGPWGWTATAGRGMVGGIDLLILALATGCAVCPRRGYKMWDTARALA
jgi:hypothetical protein